QASGTKNSMMPVSGSTSAPIASGCVPTAAEPKGSQSVARCSTCAPKLASPSVCKNTRKLISHEMNISPMATVWLATLLRLRNSTISANDSSGGMGMSQVNCWASWSERIIKFLPLHQIHILRDHRAAPAVDGDDQRQADGGFGGGHGQDDDGEHLP